MAIVRSLDQITDQVTQFVAAYANLAPKDCLPEHALSKPPLSIDNAGLGFLALSLRGYIKSAKPNNTITALEVRKKDLTLGALIDLVKMRM